LQLAKQHAQKSMRTNSDSVNIPSANLF